MMYSSVYGRANVVQGRHRNSKLSWPCWTPLRSSFRDHKACNYRDIRNHSINLFSFFCTICFMIIICYSMLFKRSWDLQRLEATLRFATARCRFYLKCTEVQQIILWSLLIKFIWSEIWSVFNIKVVNTSARFALSEPVWLKLIFQLHRKH